MKEYAIKKFFANLITCFVPSRLLRRNIREIIKIGPINAYKAVQQCRQNAREECNRTFPHFLSICAIAKDEGTYFNEWIEFHRLVGVEKFYIYDNDSSDDTKSVLEPYIKAGIVDYTWWPGIKMQLPAYADCIKKHMYDTKWLSIIDLDEFIVPVSTETIPAFLKELPSDVSQLLIGSVIYGSNGHQARPSGMVIQNYNHRMDDEISLDVKSIFKATLCWQNINHYQLMLGKSVDENGKALRLPFSFSPTHVSFKKIRLNHYFCKSWEEYQRRPIRGRADDTDGATAYNKKAFEFLDRNEVHDAIMERWIPRLKGVVKKAS